MNRNGLDFIALNEHFYRNVDSVNKRDNHIPELHYLLTEVERRYGRKVCTSADFESLSSTIEAEVHEMISSSTLKRLWGYVSSNPVPRHTTLNILSRYTGRRDFEEFCKEIKRNSGIDSTFFTAKCISASELVEHDVVVIGWNPNRMVELEYVGDHHFRVIGNENSNLTIGCVFEASSFMVGHPLYIPRILCEGKFTPPYIAGIHDGLTVVEKVERG